MMTIDIYEAMSILGVTRAMVYRMVTAGRLTRLPGKRVAGRPGRLGPAFDREEVLAVAAKRQDVTAAKTDS